jgi:DNA-binding transcriptional ArsR family regulator
MTQPVDITDPTIAKAYAHPLRIEIMGLLDNRVASPRQMATELASPLSLTSYHVRQLVNLGLVELVRRRLRRGAVEHFYTACVRPTIYDDAWAQTPSIVKQAIIGGKLSQVGREVFEAAKSGGFDRADIHLTRTRKTFTHEGWRVVSAELLGMLDRLDELANEDQARLEVDPHVETIDATVVMMLFESPPPDAFESGRAGEPLRDDELEDIAPPSASAVHRPN